MANTPLMALCHAGNVPEIEKILAGTPFDINQKNSVGYTAILFAFKGKATLPDKYKIIEALLAAGATISAEMNLYLSSKYGLLDRVHPSPDIVNTNITGPSAFAPFDTILAATCENSREYDPEGLIVGRLIASGADVNARRGDGSTALLMACKSSFLSAARQLVKAGASVNIGNAMNETPLGLARGPALIEFLHEEGAITPGMMPPRDRIPLTAYLVVGSCPFEERKGRIFYDNPHYYLLDHCVTGPNQRSSTLRYFHQNFTDRMAMTRLAERYPKMFDHIFFDVAVFKFFEGNIDNLRQFLSMLKDGGQMIIDICPYSAVPYFLLGVRNTTKEVYKDDETHARMRFNAMQRCVDSTRDRIRTFRDVQSIDLVEYSSLMGHPAGQIYTPAISGQCFLITKTALRRPIETQPLRAPGRPPTLNNLRAASANSTRKNNKLTSIGVFKVPKTSGWWGGGRSTLRKKHR